MAGRLFSLSEALELLPSAARLLEEIQQAKGAYDSGSTRLEELLAAAAGNGHLRDDIDAARQATQDSGATLEKALSELDDLGVELKGIEDGLLDFPSERDGRIVYLCWRQRDETIRFWHELSTGFAGRQPL